MVGADGQEAALGMEIDKERERERERERGAHQRWPSIHYGAGRLSS
jgi:hypothetical protein